MDDFRVKCGFFHHVKTKKLKRLIGVEGVYCFVRLWGYCTETETRRDGNLFGMDADDIELAADWSGEPGRFVRVLVDVKYLDETPQGLMIHDWSDTQRFVSSWQGRSTQSRDAAKARWKKLSRSTRVDTALAPFDEHAGDMRQACGQHAVSMRSACGQHKDDAVSMRSACEEHAVSMRSACEEHAVSMRSACEEHKEDKNDAVSMRSACGQHAVSIRSACGPHADAMRSLCPDPYSDSNPDPAPNANPDSDQKRHTKNEKDVKTTNNDKSTTSTKCATQKQKGWLFLAEVHSRGQRANWGEVTAIELQNLQNLCPLSPAEWTHSMRAIVSHNPNKKWPYFVKVVMGLREKGGTEVDNKKGYHPGGGWQDQQDGVKNVL